MGLAYAPPSEMVQPTAWVSQEHELGQITLFDPNEGSLEPLTGFELNAGIE